MRFEELQQAFECVFYKMCYTLPVCIASVQYGIKQEVPIQTQNLVIIKRSLPECFESLCVCLIIPQDHDWTVLCDHYL